MMQIVGVVALKEIPPPYFHQEDLYSFTLNVFLFHFFCLLVEGFTLLDTMGRNVAGRLLGHEPNPEPTEVQNVPMK